MKTVCPECNFKECISFDLSGEFLNGRARMHVCRYHFFLARWEAGSAGLLDCLLLALFWVKWRFKERLRAKREIRRLGKK